MFARFGICSDGNLPVIVGWATLTIWRCKIFRSPSSLPDLWLHRLDERAVQPNYECTIRENELAGPSYNPGEHEACRPRAYALRRVQATPSSYQSMLYGVTYLDAER